MGNETAGRKRLLIFIEWFTPAYKAGGPIRSVQNLIELLRDTVDIYVFAGDRDLGDTKSMSGIELNTWLQRDGLSVIYQERQRLNYKQIQNVIMDVNPDTVYMNSMYSVKFFLLPLLALSFMQYKGRVILSPRGMLKASAMKFGKRKKQIFLFFIRYTGMIKRLIFHASDQQEADDIKKWLKVTEDKIRVISNPPAIQAEREMVTKTPGFMKAIFVGRLHPIKGLDYLLDNLGSVRSNVILHVFGWTEKEDYYQLCLQKARMLPQNIEVIFHGPKPAAEILHQMKHAHIFILPTHGENFGHAIFEALAAGKPVIISDQTPWRNLEQKKAGWDVALKDSKQFVTAIETAAAMGQEEYDQMSKHAHRYAAGYIERSHLKEKYTKLFDA